jgi:hypothetical protein
MFGKTTTKCDQTQYKAEIDFKRKALWRGKYNQIAGKIKKGSNTLYSIAVSVAKPFVDSVRDIGTAIFS